MKRLLMILSCVTLISTGAQAHDGMFALFSDQINHDCDCSLPIGVPDTLYLFYVHGNGPTLGRACELRLRLSSPQLYVIGVDYSERIAQELIMGDLLNGVAFASTACLGQEYPGSPAIPYVYLATIRIVNTGDPDTCTASIVEHPASGGPRMTICETANPVHNALGDTYVFNGSCLPELELALLSDPLLIEVRFDEAVTDTSAENSANYEVFETGNEANSVPVVAAALESDLRTVTITTSDTLSPAIDWTVRATDIKDLAGNTILPGSEIGVLFLNIDLEAQMLSAPIDLNECSELFLYTIHYEVSSVGSLPSDSFRVSFRHSDDESITISDSLIAFDVFPGLSPGATVVDSFEAEIPLNAAPGDYHFGIIVDDEERNNEYFTHNNIEHIAISYTIPLINAITDIGEDQGKQVRINFSPSSRDVAGSPTPVYTYEAYRWDGSWVLAGSVPAHGESEYNMVVPTLVDSTVSQGMQWSRFVLHAVTDEPEIHFVSCADSGYSLDNIAPALPGGLGVAYNTEWGNVLTWSACEDDDLYGYRVYRGESEDFTPCPANLAHTTDETTWTDDVEEGWRYHYKVTAVDDAGNESNPAAAGSVTGSDTPDVPDAFMLYQNMPNPFNPVTSIRFDIPTPSYVRLAVFDVTGRYVRTLVDENMAAGSWTRTWDGRDEAGHAVASGLYFYRLGTASFAESKKMILLR